MPPDAPDPTGGPPIDTGEGRAEPAAPASYSTTQVARMLGVTMPTVQRWVDQGLLTAWKTLGGHRRIDAASAEALQAARRAAMAPDARPASPQDSRLRVIIVDDNPDDRDILTALCEQAFPGCSVTAVENGFQGLVAIGAQAPHVVVTDLMMPKMDGLELLAQLSAHCAVRPRLIMAATSLSDDQVRAMGTLPADVPLLRKPLDPAAFVAAARSAWQDR